MSPADEHMGRAQGLHDDGGGVVGGDAGGRATGEAQCVPPHGGIGVTQRDHPRGTDIATVDRGVTPRHDPAIRARVRARRGHARGERDRSSRGRALVDAHVERRCGRRWQRAVVGLARGATHRQRGHDRHPRYAFVWHVVPSRHIKARPKVETTRTLARARSGARRARSGVMRRAYARGVPAATHATARRGKRLRTCRGSSCRALKRLPHSSVAGQ